MSSSGTNDYVYPSVIVHDRLPEISIDENLGTSRHSEEATFFFCIRIKSPSKACCLNIFTLKTGTILIALLDIIFCFCWWMVNLISLLFGDKRRQDTTFLFFDVYGRGAIVLFAFVLALLAIRSIKRSELKFVSIYYYFKLMELVLKPCFGLVAMSVKYNFQYWWWFVLFNLARIIMDFYFAFVLMSYCVYVQRGEIVLVNSGMEVLRMMQNVRQQATALQMVAIPGHVMTDSIQEQKPQPVKDNSQLDETLEEDTEFQDE